MLLKSDKDAQKSESQKVAGGEIEMDDEFDDYMEQSLMKEADSLGIFDKSVQEAAISADVYDKALKKV